MANLCLCARIKACIRIYYSSTLFARRGRGSEFSSFLRTLLLPSRMPWLFPGRGIASPFLMERCWGTSLCMTRCAVPLAFVMRCNTFWRNRRRTLVVLRIFPLVTHQRELRLPWLAAPTAPAAGRNRGREDRAAKDRAVIHAAVQSSRLPPGWSLGLEPQPANVADGPLEDVGVAELFGQFQLPRSRVRS